MNLKDYIKKLLYPNYYSSESYINYLRRGGAKIGKGTVFYSPKYRPVDETSLPFIEIGENCRITSGVIILAHDYSYAVCRPIFHSMYAKVGVTKIGNNVFIGMNSIITNGVSIGNNVIVGAGSIVTKDVPNNVVIAGNPARIICSLEEYNEKNKKNFEYNSRIYFKRMSEYYGRELKEEEMSWFVLLWDSPNKKKILESKKVDGDDKDALISDVLNIEPKYKSFEEWKNSFIK